MPIFEEDGKPHFLLTRRTDEVKTHKGQISFPGGMRDPGESLQETALRETFEEIGIGESRIEILGRFHDYMSITGWRVVPFAAYIQLPFAAVPRKGEVAEILRVPFEIFIDPSRLRVERMFRLGEWMDIHYYRYGPHEVWGLTARIIKDFVEEVIRQIGDATLS